MEDIVPKSPDLKDMISEEEAANLQGSAFQDIQNLIEQGELSSQEIDGGHQLDRKEVERLKQETDILQEEITDNS